MKTANQLSLTDLMTLSTTRVNQVFSHYLNNIPAVELKAAMEYTLNNGGKRLRPLLIYAAGCTFDAPWENMDIPAAAVEMIHTYSLIHDDLPCMDDADLRRGKPTCHKVYGEGMAVLTGDALHTLAMQAISSYPAPLSAERRMQMMAALSQACGPYGMAAGQVLDITVMNDAAISTDLLENIYHLKTGALFSACIEMGRLASTDDDDANQRAFKIFSHAIGLAFQIQDDILDIEAESAVSGKTQGIDIKNNKMTYPQLHGMSNAKTKVQMLYQEALDAINYLGHRAQLLRDIATYMLHRNK